MKFEDLVGQTITAVEAINKDEALRFTLADGRVCMMQHHQACCEHVYIESIVGDLQDLIGRKILKAEEAAHDVEVADGDQMWTFYKLATIKGYVDIRWNGSSNGYYSIGVSFDEVKNG